MDTALPTSGPANGPPPTKKRKYKSYDVALENINEAGGLLLIKCIVGFRMSR